MGAGMGPVDKPQQATQRGWEKISAPAPAFPMPWVCPAVGPSLSRTGRRCSATADGCRGSGPEAEGFGAAGS